MNGSRKDGWRELILRGPVCSVGTDEGERLLGIWESSVRASHSFLSESDIEVIKPLVLERLFAFDHLLGVRDLQRQLVGFVGVAGDKIEALFVHPSRQREGFGRRLTDHAVNELGATAVDVNEQNEKAVAFYLRLGFRIEGRSAVDSTGRPFPLLHMRKRHVSEGQL